jgi:hypothetical protein
MTQGIALAPEHFNGIDNDIGIQIDIARKQPNLTQTSASGIVAEIERTKRRI